MNDFTKEELEEILMWSSHLAGCSPYLIKKIQSMIDNYCEHVYVMRACDCAIYCPLCGVIR